MLTNAELFCQTLLEQTLKVCTSNQTYLTEYLTPNYLSSLDIIDWKKLFL